MDENKKAVVETVLGKIEGRFHGGLYVFKGMPYAAPPLGELRWEAPAAMEPWAGVRPAHEFGRIAPQTLPPEGMLGGIFDLIITKEPQDEDCLYLNVWTPGLDTAKRPVLIWIHGGAFVIGSGSQQPYDGSVLAARGDVVVVTLNYRLGVLGFLNLDTVTGGRIPATGSEGLLDQIAALRWVRDNISAFGGDPGNITVFGESAGGMSIGCLLAMPQARGLFHKAILESGVTMPASDAELRVAEGLIDVLGVDASDVGALRELSVKTLLAAEMKLRVMLAHPGELMRLTAMVPVVGKALPLSPLDAAREGSAARVPLLVGTNLEEWKLFGLMDPDAGRLDEAMMAERLTGFLRPPAPGIAQAYRDARSKRGDSTSPFELTSAILGDSMFRMPALAMVDDYQRHGVPAYNYLFAWKSPALGGALGACHALEVGFVFGTHDALFCGSGPEADRLSRTMQDAWIAFARTGNPSCSGIGAWPPYGERRLTMMLGKQCSVQEAPYEEERLAWVR